MYEDRHHYSHWPSRGTPRHDVLTLNENQQLPYMTVLPKTGFIRRIFYFYILPPEWSWWDVHKIESLSAPRFHQPAQWKSVQYKKRHAAIGIMAYLSKPPVEALSWWKTNRKRSPAKPRFHGWSSTRTQKNRTSYNPAWPSKSTRYVRCLLSVLYACKTRHHHQRAADWIGEAAYSSPQRLLYPTKRKAPADRRTRPNRRENSATRFGQIPFLIFWGRTTRPWICRPAGGAEFGVKILSHRDLIKD